MRACAQPHSLHQATEAPHPQHSCRPLPIWCCTQITVELKNELSVTGTLHSVDQYLNIKLHNIKVKDQHLYPHMMSVRNCFVRGSVVRYIQVSGGLLGVWMGRQRGAGWNACE
jgi:U6 snRNA-associated Sm-like protein LSm2